jgi:hypothetical protein
MKYADVNPTEDVIRYVLSLSRTEPAPSTA